MKKYYPLVLYLVLAIIFYGLPLGFDFVNNILISGDPAFYLWSLKWWPYAISHSINPFLTKAFWAPFGQNIAWTTSCPSIAILMWPITNLFGPIFSYNLTTITSLALGSFGVYLICKSFDLKDYSAIFGGLIFFFSSYEWGQLSGHLNLDIIFAIPFLIYIFILRFKNLISIKRYLLFFSILLAFQFGISNEIYATFVVFGFISLLILFFMFINDKSYKQKIIKISIESFLAVLLSVILLSPYLYYIFYGYVKEPLQNISFYSADPLNFLIPTPITLFFGQMFAPISTKFAGNFSEEGAYLGLPLIFIIVTFAISLCRKNKLYFYLLLLFIAISIFSFGPYLRLLSHQIMPMPWYIFSKLPLINQALPTRFTLYIDIIASIICALWLEKTSYNKKLKIIIVFLAILFLIPNLNMYKGTDIKYPEFITSRTYKNYINKGENIIVFPTYNQGGFQGDLWQQKTDFYFNLSQGIIGPVPEKLKLDSNASWATNNLIWGQIPKYINTLSKFSFLYYIDKCNVGAILLPEDFKSPNLQKMLGLLNTKPFYIGGVVLYQIDRNYVRSALLIAKEEYHRYFINIFSTLFTSSETFLSKGNNPSNLYPQYLEENGYLKKSFGYKTGPAINWTENGGWIGKWPCPDRKGECFGIGLVGDINTLKPIIEKYKPQALQIFFPYPKVYDEKSKDTTGQLLMIFRAPK